ncbi:MAG TPA: NAD(P)H-quinone oxidoreductase [Candidatus Obscuribacterales bacterium]
MTTECKQKMRAIVITKSGDPGVLKLGDAPTPSPQKGEVRVKIKATAVNRADLLQRKGQYPPPADVLQDVPGLEFAGVVDMIGEGSSDWSVGDRVFGLCGGGSYAEYVVVHSRTLARIPDKLTFAEAAAIPEVFITAYDALVTQMQLAPGDWTLINAVGSGVGTAAVQIVKAFGGKSIGTSRNAEKLTKATEFGLSEGILASDGKFADRVMELTGGKGVDVVLELNGGAYVTEDLRCMAPKGRLTVVGLVAGASANVDLARILSRRLQIRGTTLRMRPLEEKIAATIVFSRQVVPLFENGTLKPVLDVQFPLERAAEAHEYVESDKNFGKVVLVID